jgi:hypothetical protein
VRHCHAAHGRLAREVKTGLVNRCLIQDFALAQRQWPGSLPRQRCGWGEHLVNPALSLNCRNTILTALIGGGAKQISG